MKETEQLKTKNVKNSRRLWDWETTCAPYVNHHLCPSLLLPHAALQMRANSAPRWPGTHPSASEDSLPCCDASSLPNSNPLFKDQLFKSHLSYVNLPDHSRLKWFAPSLQLLQDILLLLLLLLSPFSHVWLCATP